MLTTECSMRGVNTQMNTHFIEEKIEAGFIKYALASWVDQVTNIFDKGLPPKPFQKLLSS